MKLGGSTPTPAPADEIPLEAAPAEENPLDAAPANSAPAEAPTPDSGSSEMPFEKEPFNAGVEADEESDPKKFIEQLTGKLGQSLRQYEENQGQPDFDLEKFAINSILSATHTAEMDPKDQKDIIKKVKDSGAGDEQQPEEPETNDNTPDDGSSANVDDMLGVGSEGGEEAPMNEMSLNDTNAQKLIKIYDNGSDEVRAILARLVSFSDNVSREEFMKDLQEEIDYDDIVYIIEQLAEMGIELPEEEEVQTEGLFLKNPPKNNMFQEGSNDVLEEKNPCWDGYKQLGMKGKGGKQVPNCVKIKENLNSLGKSGIFAKANIQAILKESFNQDDMAQPVKEPVVKPTKPQTQPQTSPKPSRKSRPFLPEVAPGTRTQPKASGKDKHDYEVYNNTFSSAVQAARAYAEGFGYMIPEEEWWQKIATGPKKPSNGMTNRYSLELVKNGKQQKKMLHLQVYNTGNSYELNCYIQ